MEPGNLANSFLNSPPRKGGKNYNKNGGGGTSKAKKRYTIITRT